MQNNNISIWQSVKANFKYSLKVSSISGINYISYNTRRSIFDRAFWTVVIMTMTVLATWQGLAVYTHYKERPVIVTVDKAYFDWKLTFPTATICFESLKSDRELKRIVPSLKMNCNLSEELFPGNYEGFVNYIKDLAFKNYNNYEDYKQYATGEKIEYLKPEQYMEVLDTLVWSLDMSEKPGRIKASPLSFPLRAVRPVKRIFTEFGPCIVANPNISNYYTPEHFSSIAPYMNYSPIYYTVNTMASMTLKTMAEGNTFIYFHAPNEVMDIMDRKEVIKYSYYRQSNYETEMVTTSEAVMALSVKQKNCRLPYEPNERALEHSPVYSYNLCKFECRIKIALKYCNCTPYYYRRLAHEPICNLTGLYCLSKYKDQLIYLTDIQEQCPFCPQNCDVSIIREFKLLATNPFIQTIFEMFMQFPNKIYVRNLIFSKTDLTVQIGGIFGLFLGCSLLSFVEVVYSISLRLLCGIKSRNNQFVTN